MDSLRNRVEPFAAPFRALGIVYLPTPDPGPALLHRRTQSMSLYGHSWLNSLRRRVVPLPPPHLLSTCIIYLWDYTCIHSLQSMHINFLLHFACLSKIILLFTLYNVIIERKFGQCASLRFFSFWFIVLFQTYTAFYFE